MLKTYVHTDDALLWKTSDIRKGNIIEAVLKRVDFNGSWNFVVNIGRSSDDQ